MKRKQVLALMMTGMLTFGTAAPVAAQEPEIPQQTEKTLADETKTPETAIPETSVPEVKPEVKTETPAVTPETPQPEVQPEIQPQVQTDKEAGTASPEKDTQTPAASATAAEIAQMESAKQLTEAMFDKIINDYKQLSGEWKAQADDMIRSMFGIPDDMAVNETILNWLKAECMKEYNSTNASDPKFYDNHDDLIEFLDNIYANLEILVTSAKSDVDRVQVEYTLAAKNLQQMIVMGGEIYKDAYLKQLETALAELRELKLTTQNIGEAEAKIQGWLALISNPDLSTAIYDRTLTIADQYEVLLNLAPESVRTSQETVFTVMVRNDQGKIENLKFTYSSLKGALAGIRQRAKERLAELQKGELDEAVMMEDRSNLYQNMTNAWNGVANAINTDGEAFAARIKDLNTGHAAVYKKALQDFQKNLGGTAYAELRTAAGKMAESRKALEAQLADAEKELKDAIARGNALYEKLSDTSAAGYVKAGYTDALKAETAKAEAALKDAATTPEQKLQLAQSVEALADQETANYTDQVKADLQELLTQSQAGKAILDAVSDETKAGKDYKAAAAKNEAYAAFAAAQNALLQGGKGIDLKGLKENTAAAKADFAKDGAIAKVIRTAADKDLLHNAAALLKTEKSKKHNEGVVAAYEAAIKKLTDAKTAWEASYTAESLKTMAEAVTGLKAAETTLLKDTVQEEKKEEIKKPAEKKDTKKKDTKKKAAHTGDDTDAGLYGLLAMAGAGLAASLKKRKF